VIGILCSLKRSLFQASQEKKTMPRTPTSPTSGRPKNMFSTFFSSAKPQCPKLSAPGIVEGEEDCLHDESLESAALTAIWRSTSSKVRFILVVTNYSLTQMKNNSWNHCMQLMFPELKHYALIKPRS